MRYLLDTSVFLWLGAAPNKLNRRAIRVLEGGRDDLYLSAASSWEIAIKVSTGKLRLPSTPSEYVSTWMASLGARALDISHMHALTTRDLPAIHSDPFDRILIAQAQVEGFTILTGDPVFDAYKTKTLWAGK